MVTNQHNKACACKMLQNFLMQDTFFLFLNSLTEDKYPEKVFSILHHLLAILLLPTVFIWMLILPRQIKLQDSAIYICLVCLVIGLFGFGGLVCFFFLYIIKTSISSISHWPLQLIQKDIKQQR